MTDDYFQCSKGHISKRISKLTRITVFFFCRSPHGASHLCKVYKYVTETVIFSVQRPVTQKKIKPDIWFLRSTCHLILLFIFARLQENLWNHFQVIKGHKCMTGIFIYNVQRAVTPKESNLELSCLCSAHHIIVIYICIKLQENVSKSFQVTERTHLLQKSLFSMFKGP